MAAAAHHFGRRVAAVREAIAGAEDFDAAARSLIELAARWTPDALARLLGDAMELAAWSGREAAFAETDDARFADPEFGPQTFREQIDYLTQKRPKPTRVWTDAMAGDHDRAFVIAGATDIAMLEEFQAALIAAAPSRDLAAFARDFDRIVETYGWSYNGGREWRIRTIFNTNIRTSYMAGRLKQMRDPEVVKLLPYWQYIHGATREPLKPRPEHVAWDGLVLDWNDPWWDTHFPPNDWLCSCGVRSLSEAQVRRLGKRGPDTAPPLDRQPYLHRASGQGVMLPKGIGYGWDHMPGDLWERGLVPSALIEDPAATAIATARGTHVVSITEPEPMAELRARAKAFTATPMPPGLAPETYVEAFLKAFGTTIGDAVLYEDAAGVRVVISDLLFRDPDGGWKVAKRGHGEAAPLLAEAIMDPDEIWIGVREVPVDERRWPGITEYHVTRRYVRVDPKRGVFALFELGRRIWSGVTGYEPRNRSKTDFRHLDAQRVGKLVWKRK